MTQASAFLKLSPQEVVTHEWEVLDDPGHFGIDDLIATVIGLLFFIIPGIIILLVALMRPARRGYMCLTNWRLLYYERGEGAFRNFHHVSSVDLDDIVSLHSTYTEGLFGTKSLTTVLSTKHDDSIVVRIGDSGAWFSSLPVIGALCRRSTMGRDATKVAPVLFALIEESRSEASGSRLTF